MAGGGKFRTLPLTRHSTTNIEIIKKFMDINIDVEKNDKDIYEVRIG
jgi:RNA 3'-terminal phosphate cyclase